MVKCHLRRLASPYRLTVNYFLYRSLIFFFLFISFLSVKITKWIVCFLAYCLFLQQTVWLHEDRGWFVPYCIPSSQNAENTIRCSIKCMEWINKWTNECRCCSDHFWINCCVNSMPNIHYQSNWSTEQFDTYFDQINQSSQKLINPKISFRALVQICSNCNSNFDREI